MVFTDEEEDCGNGPQRLGKERDTMNNIFVYSVNDEPAMRRFTASVRNGYDMEHLLPLIEDSSHRDALQQLYRGEKCYLWGEAEDHGGTTRSEWECMTERDLVLGYREQTIISVSRVVYKMSDPSLADHLWGNDEGSACSLIFFMTTPHLCNVTIVPRMFAYLDPPYDGLSHLGPDKLENIRTHYVSSEDFARLLFGQDFPASLRHSL
jgi:hypothetical protein